MTFKKNGIVHATNNNRGNNPIQNISSFFSLFTFLSFLKEKKYLLFMVLIFQFFFHIKKMIFLNTSYKSIFLTIFLQI